VVATASLDLGVDFPTVEQVIQIGSPKGIARLIQRAGRAGHRPGGTARIVCVPTHALEILELAAVRERLREGRVEARRPIRLSLDVLAQHLVTIALGGGFAPEAMFDEVRRTHAFAGLTREHWQWVLDFITRGGPALKAYPDFQKVVECDGLMRVPNRRIAMLHRLNIGTITADGAMQVRFVKGGALGSIEERFLARLRPGDRFVFAGRTLELVRIRDMTAYVRKASGKATVPAWAGGRLPLSTLLADGMLKLIDSLGDGRPGRCWNCSGRSPRCPGPIALSSSGPRHARAITGSSTRLQAGWRTRAWRRWWRGESRGTRPSRSRSRSTTTASNCSAPRPSR